MGKLFNRVRQATATTGTGTVTLGAASSGYQTLASAGAVTGDIVSYFIEDGTAWEVGVGIYNSVGPTLTRQLVQSSTGSLLTLTGSATVTCGANSMDLSPSLPGMQSGAYRFPLPINNTARTPTPGTGIFTFFDVQDHTRIQAYGSRTHSTGSGQAAFALYASGPNGFPTGSPLHGGGLITPTYSFVLTGYSGIDVILPRGRIWFAVCLAAGSTASFTDMVTTDVNLNWRRLWNFPTSLLGSESANNFGAMTKSGMTAGTWPTLSDSYGADAFTITNAFDMPNLYIRGF